MLVFLLLAKKKGHGARKDFIAFKGGKMNIPPELLDVPRTTYGVYRGKEEEEVEFLEGFDSEKEAFALVKEDMEKNLNVDYTYAVYDFKEGKQIYEGNGEVKKFVAYWGKGYDETVKIVRLHDFGEDNGYDDEDREGIDKLEVGETYSPPCPETHVIMRVE